MTRLAAALGVWLVGTTLASVGVERAFALQVDEGRPRAVIASVWSRGELVARSVLARPEDTDPAIEAALGHPGATLVHENVVGEGPVVPWFGPALAMSFVPGRDGLALTFGGRTEYVTPDELLSRQAYDEGLVLPVLGAQAGVDMPVALAILGDRFGVPVPDLLERGHLRRIRTVRTFPSRAPAPVVTANSLSADDLRAGALAAARHLARGVDEQGRFRYRVDAPSNRALSGYDWPRHAGATYFLAQVAGLSGDPLVASAALRAAAHLRDHAMLDCAGARCVGDARVVEIGSTALAIIAFTEIARTGLGPAYADLVPSLTTFLRAQQRPDGEWMHQFDRGRGAPVDVQFLYYSGEAALALSRAHSLLGDPRDLEAARRALAHLAGPAWSFFGSRYYFGEEHWTCQAMDDLWDRAPNADALDLCLRWLAYERRLTLEEGQVPFDADGAYGLAAVPTPRLTPVGSRCEAAIATLDAAEKSGRQAPDLQAQIRRSLAMLLRHQLGPNTAHLMADPAAVEGAMPSTEVDWELRIDFAQHTGSALVSWLSRVEASPGPDAGDRFRHPTVDEKRQEKP